MHAHGYTYHTSQVHTHMYTYLHTYIHTYTTSSNAAAPNRQSDWIIISLQLIWKLCHSHSPVVRERREERPGEQRERMRKENKGEERKEKHEKGKEDEVARNKGRRNDIQVYLQCNCC